MTDAEGQGGGRPNDRLPPVRLDGCEPLRQTARDCRLVVLAATEDEAAPLLGALSDPRPYLVATKQLFTGRYEPARSPAAADSPAKSVRAVLAISGCDKTNAAHMLTCLLQAMRPEPLLVLQVGVAGAFPGRGEGSGARVGDIVVATEEIYSDTGSSSPGGWLSAAELGLPIAQVDGTESGGRFAIDPRLVRAAVEAIEAVDTDDWPASRPTVVVGSCVTASRVTGVRTEGEAVARRWGAVAESMEGAAAAHVCALYGVPFLAVRGISNLIVDRDRASWEVGRAIATAARAALAVVAALDHFPLEASGMAGASSALATTSLPDPRV